MEHWFLSSMETLGRRTAELHLALARRRDPAFAPEPYGAEQLRDTVEEMTTHANAVLDLLKEKIEALPETARASAERVAASRPRILRILESLAAVQDAGLRIRIHGDYHLGQVLRTEEDFVILDFEGEPARSLAERRMKHSPLKDVTGMLRSFGYAAYAGLSAFTVHAPEQFSSLEQWANTWEHWVSEAFSNSYRATLKGTPLLPSPAGWASLARAFALDKALYEVAYELNSRPDWLPIPLTGILKLI
jgi:maltose alpha-D-glucosyltransferase/alpha-amylase